MPKSWSEPFLWIHVAGVFTLPFWLTLCALGLASSEALLPIGLERLLVALLTILPIVVMQCYRPFNIFSLLFLAVPPAQLDDDRRRILATFHAPAHLWLTAAVAALLFCLLQNLYSLYPLLQQLSPFPHNAFARFAFATIGFLGANLFLQVPMAALRVMALPDTDLEAIEPVSPTEAAQDFLLWGLPTNNLLGQYWPVPPKAGEIAPKAEPDASETETETATA